MNVELPAKSLLDTLKRLLPKKKAMLKQGPLVTLHAEADVLIVSGEFENAWSLPASVRHAGRCTVDLETFIARLKTYDQKAPIRLQADDDGLRFGTTRMVLHKERKAR